MYKSVGIKMLTSFPHKKKNLPKLCHYLLTWRSYLRKTKDQRELAISCACYIDVVLLNTYTMHETEKKINFLVGRVFKILGSMHRGWYVCFASFKEYTLFGACVHVMKVREVTSWLLFLF